MLPRVTIGVVDDSTKVILEAVVGDSSWWYSLCAFVSCIVPYDGGVFLMAQTGINCGCRCKYRHLNLLLCRRFDCAVGDGIAPCRSSLVEREVLFPGETPDEMRGCPSLGSQQVVGKF